MKKKKSFIAIIVVVILMATFFSGCSSGSKGTEQSNTQTSSNSNTDGKTKITIWHYYSTPSQQQGFNNLINKFNASQDKIKVTAQFVPREELTKQLTIGLVSDKLPDIAIVDNPDMASFASMGLFADITDKVKPITDEFFPGPIKSCELNGKYYGVPLGSNDLALFYNKDMLNAVGVKPPTTFEELRTAAKKLTNGSTYGFALAAPKDDEGSFQYLPWLLSTGAKFNEIGSKAGISSLTYLTDLIKDRSMSKDVVNWTQNDLEKQFVTNKAAMIEDGPWIINTIKKDAPNLNWGVVLLPKDKMYSSDLGGENWGIIKGHNEAAAWQFIKYTEQSDVMNAYCDLFGYIPPIKSVAESNDKITKDPVMSVFYNELQYAMPRGPHPKWPQISDAMATAVQESLTNAETPEQAAKDAQAKIDAVLK
jgi:multiple sugar transport system substrate-binding protein